MNDQAPNVFDEDEISILDLLVTVSENLKLLILGPILAGLAALGVGFFAVEPTFESTSVIQSDQPAFPPDLLASLALQPTLLDRVANEVGLREKFSAERARKELKLLIKPSVGKKDKLLNITTEWSTAEGAQKLNKAVLAALLQQATPRGTERAAIERALADERSSLKEGMALERRLATQLSSSSGQRDEVSARLYALLLPENSAKQKLIAELEAKLRGISEDDVLQEPTLAERPTKPKKALMAVVTALATGFVLLLLVFVRQALRASASDPEAAAKIARIQRGLRFWSSTSN